MSERFIPINDKILVKRDEAEERTQGGLYLPDNAKLRPSRGVVMAVGKGKLKENGERQLFSVCVGDRVYFTNYAGNEVEIGGEKFFVMYEQDILGIITDKK